jgi:hypothetical protein
MRGSGIRPNRAWCRTVNTATNGAIFFGATYPVVQVKLAFNCYKTGQHGTIAESTGRLELLTCGDATRGRTDAKYGTTRQEGSTVVQREGRLDLLIIISKLYFDSKTQIMQVFVLSGAKDPMSPASQKLVFTMHRTKSPYSQRIRGLRKREFISGFSASDAIP